MPQSTRLLRSVGAIAAALILAGRGAGAATITVNGTADTVADDGVCTLREAIVAANTNAASGVTTGECAAGQASPTVDQIAFAIPPLDGTVKTITLASSLPDVVDPVLIDGYTQPGARANTKAVGDDAVVLIKLDASAVGFFVLKLCNPIGCGELGSSDGSTVEGLCIVAGNHATLVDVRSNDDLVAGNFLGVDTDGATLVGDPGYVVEAVNGISGATIGGTTPAMRNVIAGTNSDLILTDANGTTIQGNYIGINAAGTAALGPGPRAIDVELGTGITIGGSTAGAGNVIGTWFVRAIQLGEAGAFTTADVVIQGNLIGTDATGTTGISHGGSDAISVGRVANTTIGGSAAGAGNVIANPGGDGIVVLGDSGGVSGVTIQGNKIGTDVTGTSPIPNGHCGINVSGFNGVAIGSIGGTGAGEGNVIAFNGTHGIGVAGSVTGWAIEGNSVFGNGNLGITLGGDCGSASVTATPNDPGDGDPGANDLQNFPVLDTPDFPGGTSVSGTLNSTAGHTFRIEVFANDACDSSGFGEGKTFVGTVDTGPTDTNGDVGFTVSFGKTIGATALTATATDLTTGDTSEFSACQLPPTTTTTTTVPATSTSSTTTSSGPPTTTSPVSTTTSTQHATTSSTSTSTTPTTALATTTTLAAACGDVPDGPTFASIVCRIQMLLDQVNAEPGLGKLQSALAHTLTIANARAGDARDLCAASNAKKSKKRLAQTKHTLGQYVHRLGSKPAHKLDDTLRRTFIGRAQAIEPDVQSLHGTVRCPADANH